MAFLNSLNISGSGLTAQRFRLDIIAQNIANQDTTRTEAGGPYTRKLVVLESRSSSFADILAGRTQGAGVRVREVAEDTREYKRVYDPSHPDANEEGYVLMPNVDMVKEMTDMIAASRAFDANITAFNAVKQMASRALEIGR